MGSVSILFVEGSNLIVIHGNILLNLKLHENFACMVERHRRVHRCRVILSILCSCVSEKAGWLELVPGLGHGATKGPIQYELFLGAITLLFVHVYLIILLFKCLIP